jgi:hypothetical protein
MKRVFVLTSFVWCSGCEKEPACDTIQETATDLSCEAIDLCCQGNDCWYEDQRGTRYECLSSGNCGLAALEVVCATCEMDEQTATEVGC